MACCALLQRSFVLLISCCIALLAACGPGRFKMNVVNPARVEVRSLFVIVSKDALPEGISKDPSLAAAALNQEALSGYAAYGHYKKLDSDDGRWEYVDGKNRFPGEIELELTDRDKQVRVVVPRAMFSLFPELSAAAVLMYAEGGKLSAQAFDRAALEGNDSVLVTVLQDELQLELE